MADDETETMTPPGNGAAAAPPTGTGGPTADHDDWLHKTLGLDVSQFVNQASAAVGAAATAVADAGAKVVGEAHELGGEVVDAMNGSGEALGGGIKDMLARAKTAVASAADTVMDSASAAVGKVVDGVEGAIGTVVDGVEGAIDTVVGGVKSIFAGPPPIKRVELGPAQTDRASKLMKDMPPADQEKVKALLDRAKPDEAKYLQKALASHHSAAELETFYKAIEGKDAAWMDQNLHVIGQSDGKGIKQQWHDSCGPTTVQAMKAELDPVYALKLRTEATDVTKADDSDGTKLNTAMAEEQRRTLVDHGGVAVDRDKDGGDGMGLDETLEEQGATTGLTFDRHAVTKDNVSAELDEVDSAVNSGLPVPLRVGDDQGGHFVMVMGMDPGPPRRYAIHDPWNGRIENVTEKEIKDQTMDIAGWNKLTHIYKPKPKPEPAP